MIKKVFNSQRDTIPSLDETNVQLMFFVFCLIRFKGFVQTNPLVPEDLYECGDSYTGCRGSFSLQIIALKGTTSESDLFFLNNIYFGRNGPGRTSNLLCALPVSGPKQRWQPASRKPFNVQRAQQ